MRLSDSNASSRLEYSLISACQMVKSLLGLRSGRSGMCGVR